MEKQRNSSLECLRIICIFGIIVMHTFGIFYSTATGINLIAGTIINSIFNMGVSIFMLISGYFGIQFSLKKLINLECTVLFYSLLSLVLQGVCLNTWSLSSILKAFFPISTKHYWFISVYMILFAFSGYINKIPEKLEKQAFKKLIFLMLLFFSMMPTITYFEIMEDGGKGLMNMFLMYMIGRYINIYNVKIPRKACGGGVSLAIIVTFLLNYALSVLRGGVGLFAPFARDNSMTIIAGSIYAFLFFKNFTFYSRIINRIAKGMFAVYLFEGSVRSVLNKFIPWEKFASVWYLFVLIVCYAIAVMIICLIIEAFRKAVFRLFEEKIANVFSLPIIS